MAARRAKGAISFSPTRILGALSRRGFELRRRRSYLRAREQPMRHAVLFESFAGKVIGDSPFEIYRDLDARLRAAGRREAVEILWTVDTADAEVPEGTTRILLGSPAWVNALGTCRYIVNNTNNPWFFRKRPGQYYLQTWHGTPLKRLVFDIEGGTVTQGYLHAFERDAAMWDWLISPNPYSSAIFTRAFRYGGTMLETGYPRNDRLVTATAAERQAIRERLGVTDPERKLLLYGPTWRDTNRTATGKWASVDFFDHTTTLPEGWTMLFRGHTNTHAAHVDRTNAQTIDVTRYPNTTDLLIACDALLTDYSSLMFDHTVTGKPILFLVPDLDHYVGSRGFYFDFRAQAPGPLLTDSAQVVDALGRLDAVREEYAERYAQWRRTYNPWEDGRAASRVVDAAFRGLLGR